MLFVYIYFKCLNFVVCGWGQCIYCQVVNYVCHRVSVRIPVRASKTLKAPRLWWFMYVEAEGTGLFSVSAWVSDCPAPNGPLVEHLGRGRKWSLTLTHICHLQMQRLGIEASFQRAKIEIGIGSRHEMGSRDSSLKHTHIYTHTLNT